MDIYLAWVNETDHVPNVHPAKALAHRIISDVSTNGLRYVSSSHVRDFTAVCVSRYGGIGIDVEDVTVRRDIAAISDRAFPFDVAISLGNAPPDAFYARWVATEALVKARGERLADWIGKDILQESGAYEIFSMRPDRRYILAVASRHHIRIIRVFRARAINNGMSLVYDRIRLDLIKRT